MPSNLHHVAILNGSGQIKEHRLYRINDRIAPDREIIAMNKNLTGSTIKLRVVKIVDGVIHCRRVKR